jgi:hypothetical protein
VCAGQALERVLLTAAVKGLAAAPPTQAMEVAELRQLFGPGTPRRGAVVTCLGYASGTRPTPRRPLSDVLIQARD